MDHTLPKKIYAAPTPIPSTTYRRYAATCPAC
jgi:hypothetical protein